VAFLGGSNRRRHPWRGYLSVHRLHKRLIDAIPNNQLQRTAFSVQWTDAYPASPRQKNGG
jgi:hypothetical protein